MVTCKELMTKCYFEKFWNRVHLEEEEEEEERKGIDIREWKK